MHETVRTNLDARVVTAASEHVGHSFRDHPRLSERFVEIFTRLQRGIVRDDVGGCELEMNLGNEFRK